MAGRAVVRGLPGNSSNVSRSRLSSTLTRPFRMGKLGTTINSSTICDLRVTSLTRTTATRLQAINRRSRFLNNIRRHPIRHHFRRINHHGARFRVSTIRTRRRLTTVRITRRLFNREPCSQRQATTNSTTRLGRISINILQGSQDSKRHHHGSNRIACKLCFTHRGHRNNSQHSSSQVILHSRTNNLNTSNPLLHSILFFLLVSVTITSVKASRGHATIDSMRFFLLFRVKRIFTSNSLQSLRRFNRLNRKSKTILLGRHGGPIVAFQGTRGDLFTKFIRIDGIWSFHGTEWRGWFRVYQGKRGGWPFLHGKDVSGQGVVGWGVFCFRVRGVVYGFITGQGSLAVRELTRVGGLSRGSGI